MIELKIESGTLKLVWKAKELLYAIIGLLMIGFFTGIIVTNIVT